MNLVGNKYGKLTIVKRAKNRGNCVAWVCLCDCGEKCVILSHHLTQSHDAIKSCGCLKKSLMQGTTIICKICKIEKPIFEFYSKYSQAKTKSNTCKECTKPINNEKKKERDREYRFETLCHYGGNPPKCACCGISFIEFLAFDHINGDGAKHRKEIGRVKMHLWLRKNNYPSGFRILCHNCNTSLGSYGRCPHGNPEISTRINR